MFKDNGGNSLAFGIILAGVFLVAASILIGMFLIPWNISFIPVFNSLLISLPISQQTADTFGFYRNVSVAVPVFILFGLLLWAWIRGLEARN